MTPDFTRLTEDAPITFDGLAHTRASEGTRHDGSGLTAAVRCQSMPVTF